MIQTYPYRCSVCLADLDKLGELLASLVMILMEVSRIDPDLLYNGSGCNRYLRGEMHISHKRNINAACTQDTLDFCKRIHLCH